MILTTSKKAEADFYIARVGSKAGMPMWEPYTSNNSFKVLSNNPEADFAAVQVIHSMGMFKEYTYGASQPMIRRKDAQKVANRKIPEHIINDLRKINSAIDAKANELERLKDVRLSYLTSAALKIK